MSKMNTLEDLLVDELKDLYNAEQQITRALPKMAQAASAPELQRAFETHLKQTEGHIARLTQVFERMGEQPKGKVCRAMQGLIAEGEEMLEQDAEPSVMDAGLIAMAQRVEHYEIAGYGCVRAFAEELGHAEIARLLGQTLEEEKTTDQQLTKIAEGRINQRAEYAAMTR